MAAMEANNEMPMNEMIARGVASYDQWREGLLATPDDRFLYEEEARKKELWLQLVEAREAAGMSLQEMADRLGVSEAHVARIERRGYDASTVRTLQRYVNALGDDFSLTVVISRRPHRGATEKLLAAS